MDSEMVRQAACAVHATMCPDGEASGFTYDRASPAHQGYCARIARAVIAALREPTEAMLDASWKHTQTRSAETRMVHMLADRELSAKTKAAQRWSAMIDAALAATPPNPSEDPKP